MGSDLLKRTEHVSPSAHARSQLHPRCWEILEAARVPRTLKPQIFGLWRIRRMHLTSEAQAVVGWATQTVLERWTDATMHLNHGEIVMEDGWIELRRHLPIWLAAEGRVLLTGLGLGCVVRGLLANPRVTQVDVIEKDPQILAIVGAEFRHNPRVWLLQADALTVDLPPAGTYAYGWHDIWDQAHLHVLHAQILVRFAAACRWQGAWQFPRLCKRTWPFPLLGGTRRRRMHVA